MRKLTMNDLKVNVFNPATVAEQIVSFDGVNSSEKLDEIDEVLYGIESLKEAIFYKIEKAKKICSSDKEDSLNKMYKELKTSVRNLHLDPIDSSAEILDKKTMLFEMQRISKILKYSVGLSRNSEQTLGMLLESDHPEDWDTLSEIIHYQLKFGDQQNSECFLKFSKKIEQKMISNFKESIINDDIALAKQIFDILKTIDKEMAAIDQFLHIKNLLSYPSGVHPPAVVAINLDKIRFEEDAFSLFIDDVKTVVERNKHSFFRIFGSETVYKDHICSRIYKTLIGMTLEKALNVSNPAIFLISLYGAYQKILEFSKFLVSLFSKFDYNSYISEILNQFKYKAINKESQLFDEILNVFVFDSKTLNNFYILDEKVVKTENMVKVFEKMLILIDSMLRRSSMLYSDEDERDILGYFSKKLCIIVDKIMASDSDKSMIIDSLRHICVLNRRFFNENIHLMDSFDSKLSNSIIQVFDEKLALDRHFFKNEISNMFFARPDTHKNLFEHFKKTLSTGKILTTTNYLGFVENTINTVYSLLYKQVQMIELKKNTVKNMEKCVDDILGYVSLHFENTMENKFKILKAICNLICVDKNGFMASYSKVSSLIRPEDLRIILKCRPDKNDIKAMICK